MKEICSYCESKNTIKNGETHYEKQNYKCNICHRQFVLGGSDWFISDAQKDLINALLLERIAIAGIARVMKISETWLLNYIKKLYKELPDNLNADLSLPDLEFYLKNRFDEEIKGLEKKTERCQKYIKIPENEEIETLEFDTIPNFDWLDDDLLIEEIYAKERGSRLQVFGIQLD